jgi:hypothetical protein
MSGSLSSFGRLQTLLHQTTMTPTQFVRLCQAFDIDCVTDASLSRAIKAGSFKHDVELALRPVITRLEDLVDRCDPFPVAFDDTAGVKDALDYIEGGIDLRTGVFQTNSTAK